MAFARRNHHLVKGEQVKWSRKGREGYHTIAKASDRGVVTLVRDDSYRVKWKKGALKGSSTIIPDEWLVSARSTSRSWPGNHYEGLSPKYGTLKERQAARKNPRARKNAYRHSDLMHVHDYEFPVGRKNPMHWPKTISSKLGKWKQVEAGDEYASYDLSKWLPGNEEYTVVASAEKIGTVGGWKVSFFEESTMGGKEIITSKSVDSPLSAIKAMKAHWPKPALLLPARDPRLGGRLARNNMGFKLTDSQGREHEADTFAEYLQMKDAMGGGKKKRSRTSAVRRTKKAFSPPRDPTALITEKQGYGLLKWLRPNVRWKDAVEGMIAHGMTQQQWYDAIQLASKKQKIPAMKSRIEEWARG